MPDITMCSGNECSKHRTCYRYTASPNVYRQSYFLIAPVDSAGNCMHYTKDNRTKNEIKKDQERYLEDVKKYNAWHIANGTPDFVPIVP